MDLPDQFNLLLQSWDMSFKDSANSDFVVGQILAACGAHRYVLDQIRDRLDFPRTAGSTSTKPPISWRSVWTIAGP